MSFPEEPNEGELMDLPQPIRTLQTQAAGWWKAPASLGTDPAFLRVPDEIRVAAVGLHVGAVGWCLNHDARDGWIPEAAVLSGQVVPSLREILLDVCEGLVLAGLWIRASKEGMEGFVVAGAEQSVRERFARQESARQAGITSREVASQRSPDKRKRVDANNYVDWSKEDGTL